MRRSPKPSRQHEHEFLAEREDDVTVEFDGDYVYASVQCIHAPVISSAHSEKHDETFYEHGPRCEATRRTDVKVSDPVNEMTGETVTYDDQPYLWENIVLSNIDNLERIVAEQMVGEWAEDEAAFATVGPDGDRYRIDLEVDKRRVDQ